MSLSTLKQVKRVDLVLNDLNKHLPSINLETFTCKLSSMEKGFTPSFLRWNLARLKYGHHLNKATKTF